MRTKLDAINACLRGVGIAPVATENDSDLDAATASVTIDEASLDLQSRGWWFNKEKNWRITPDETTGYVSVPGSVLSITTSGKSRNTNLTVRDGLLYDLHTHTYDLRSVAVSDSSSGTAYIELTIIFEVVFDDLPEAAKQAIIMRAKRMFAQNLEVDVNRYKFQEQDEKEAYNNLLRMDAKNNKYNSFTNNPQMQYFINRATSPNSLLANIDFNRDV